MPPLSRRDALKLLATLPAGMALSRLLPQASSAHPNIILIVLDTLTARNISLHGYRRETMPNLAQFADRANVYHAHHSAGTFTTAGVSSLLTATYPWTHRAVNMKGLIARDRTERNIFNLLKYTHETAAFTQNYFADYILMQFHNDIKRHYPTGTFAQLKNYLVQPNAKDAPTKFRAVDDFLVNSDDLGQYQGSPLFGNFFDYYKSIVLSQNIKDGVSYYEKEIAFNLSNVFSGLSNTLNNFESPFFAYYHLYPPHAPYRPLSIHQNLFNDGWTPDTKPAHAIKKFADNSPAELISSRLEYDRFLVTVDAAFGEFIKKIEADGLLKNSVVILTSDHGESFERGYLMHAQPLVYETSIHVPLLISMPNQTTRRDFYETTNSVDILPTLLKIANVNIPDWCEGQVLPGFNENFDSQRATFSMAAITSPAYGKLNRITSAMFKEEYKLIYYRYEGEKDIPQPYQDGAFELYNLKEDPEELNNLIGKNLSVEKSLRDEFLETYNAASQPL